jgi:hypothetical protein
MRLCVTLRRERIIFENVKDLSDCIEGLANDPEVQVVRVKSSMTRAGLNPVANTGYKFVSINLRIRVIILLCFRVRVFIVGSPSPRQG